MFWLSNKKIIFCYSLLTKGLRSVCRVFALVLQFVIRKKTGILVKIGRVGLGIFYRIHIEVKKGLHVVKYTIFDSH